MDPKPSTLKLILLGAAAAVLYTWVGPLGLVLIGIALYIAS